jgi:MFS family permease
METPAVEPIVVGEDPSDPRAEPAAAAGKGTLGLGFFFGTIYLVQAVADPSDGLVTQPVIALLKGWGWGAEAIAGFVAALAISWSLKPLYGLVTDFIPLAGSRRRSYLILASAVAIALLAALAAWRPDPSAWRWLFLLLLGPSIAVAFSDVVVDALCVEEGQPRGITGKLQAAQWGALYAGTILTGVVGGRLSEHGLQNVGYAVCAGLMIVALVLAAAFARERRPATPPRGLRPGARALWRDVRSPTVLGVGAFLVLWNFNPFSNTVLNVHMTRAMGFSETFYGDTQAYSAAASVVACAAYGAYCRRVPMAVLVHASIVLGIVSTLAYALMTDERSAVLVSIGIGFTYMTATLIQLDLAARACPPAAAGTLFATIMALENVSASVSSWLGGRWYERWAAQAGERAAFAMLVGVGAAFTGACWALWPLQAPAVQPAPRRASGSRGRSHRTGAARARAGGTRAGPRPGRGSSRRGTRPGAARRRACA